MYVDGGMGAGVHLADDHVEVHAPEGTTRLGLDRIAGVTVSGGRLSRSGTVELRLVDGSRVGVPFARERRGEAKRMAAAIERAAAPAIVARRRAEVEGKVDELRQRTARTVQRRRAELADRVARGAATLAEQQRFEEEAARIMAEAERQAERTLRAFEEQARASDGREAP